MNKVFITGGTGQVGHEVVKLFLEEQSLSVNKPQDIICLARTPRNAIYLMKNNVTIIKGSLSQKKRIIEAFQYYQPNVVFHIAANIDVNASLEQMMRDNFYGTKNVLEAFVKSKAITFVFASSVVVYDHSTTIGNHTEFKESDPINYKDNSNERPYTISKRKCEVLIQRYQELYPNKNFVIARLSPIIGNYDRMFIPTTIEAFNLPIPKLIDKGSGKLSLTSSEDIARALIFLVIHITKTKSQIFNIAHTTKTFFEIFIIIAHFLNKPKPLLSIPKNLFLLILPILSFMKKITPKSRLLQIFLSDTTLDYLTHTYIYNSDKIKKLGFKFQSNITHIFRNSIDFRLKEKN